MALDQPVSAKIARGYLGCSRSVYVARIAGEGDQVRWKIFKSSGGERMYQPKVGLLTQIIFILLYDTTQVSNIG